MSLSYARAKRRYGGGGDLTRFKFSKNGFKSLMKIELHWGISNGPNVYGSHMVRILNSKTKWGPKIPKPFEIRISNGPKSLAKTYYGISGCIASLIMGVSDGQRSTRQVHLLVMHWVNI